MIFLSSHAQKPSNCSLFPSAFFQCPSLQRPSHSHTTQASFFLPLGHLLRPSPTGKLSAPAGQGLLLFSFTSSVMLQTIIILQSSDLVSLQEACPKDTAPPTDSPCPIISPITVFYTDETLPLFVGCKLPESRDHYLLLLCISASAPIPLPGPKPPHPYLGPTVTVGRQPEKRREEVGVLGQCLHW